MRWFLIVSFLLIASPAFAQENEAEKLFRAMEKKIQEAKSLSVVAEFSADYGGLKVSKIKVQVLVATGDKVRVESEKDVGDNQLLLLSDGKKMIGKRSGSLSEGDAVPTNAGLSDAAGAMLGRMGVTYGSAASEITAKGRIDIEKKFPASDFRLVSKERIGTQEIQALEYVVDFGGKANERTKVTLWIDVKTMLPLKRHVEIDNTSFSSTETYSEFTLNPQLDPKLFELPK